jgi:DNA repair exonuclease SbcCD nuclease subunit
VAGAPPIHFPGNIQGRHIRETGAKGCLLVTVDDRGQASAEFRPLDVFRWELCDVDATGADRPDEVAQRFAIELKKHLAAAEERPLAVRVRISGACRAHQPIAADPLRWNAELQSIAGEIGSGQVWIEKISRRTSLPRDIDVSALLDGPVGELAAYLEELQQNDELLAGLLAEIPELGSLQSRLPADIAEGVDALKLTDPAWVRAQFDDVREFLLHRLLAGTSEQP